MLLPSLAPELGAGLPSEVAPEYRAGRTIPRRLLAMTEAAVRPGRLRARLAGADVVHYPLTLRLPPVSRPTVTSLLDVQHLDLPQMFSRAERAFRAVAWARSVRSSDRVIVISEFVRDRAVAKLGLDPDLIRVIHLGVDHERLGPGTAPREEFLLYPARRWPHKNHDRLFAAFALLRRNHPDLRLVLTGGGDFSDVPAGVEARGHVTTAEVDDLMRRAAALVFPLALRGLRPAAARGDGVRLPRRELERGLAARGRRRRCAPLRSVPARGDRGGGRGRAART